MSNLFEKALLTGFGIFILIIFLSIITPFLGIIVNYNRNQRKELDCYTNLINEIENALNQVIEAPEITFREEVEYPLHLNITLEQNYAKFYFPIENKTHVRILELEENFHPRIFHNLPAKTYLLIISIDLLLINLSFIEKTD